MKKLKIVLPVLLLSWASYAQTRVLTLQDALSLAARSNRTIQIGKLEAKKAEQFINEQRSFLKPSVSASANYSLYVERPVIFLRNETASSKVNAVEVGGRNAFAGGISASYPILSPIIQKNIELTTIQARQQKERAEDITAAILLNVSQTYYTIQFYKEQTELFRHSLQRNEQALKDARLLFLQGRGLKTDTLRTYIDVQNVKASIATLESKILIESLHLKQMIGLDEAEALELSDSLQPVTDKITILSPQPLLQMAFEKRADIKMQELQVQYNQVSMERQAAEFKPSLSATAQYQVQSQSDRFGFLNGSLPRTSYIGLQLNVPIFSGKRAKYKKAAAEMELEKSKILLDDVKAGISKELQSLNENLKDAHLQREIQQKNLEAAQVNFNMITDRFKYGLSNRLELTDAEVMLTQAKVNHLHSLLNIKLTELQLERALGKLKAE